MLEGKPAEDCGPLLWEVGGSSHTLSCRCRDASHLALGRTQEKQRPGGFAALLFLSLWHRPGAATGGWARHIAPPPSILPLPTVSTYCTSCLVISSSDSPVCSSTRNTHGVGGLRLSETPLQEERAMSQLFVHHSLSFLKNSNFNPSIISLAKRHNEHFRKLLKVIIEILKMCIYIILIICQCFIHLSCSILTMFGENYHYHHSLLHLRKRKSGEVRSCPRSHSWVNGGVQTWKPV